MKNTTQEFFLKSKVLSKERHERLIANIDNFAATAGITPAAITKRMSESCTTEEIEWVRTCARPNDSGLCFVGPKFNPMVPDKMVAITAALLRNYVDARVMMALPVVNMLQKDDMPDPTFLLIPNFCLAKDAGGHLAPWQSTALLGLLLDRISRGRKTIIYVNSMHDLEVQYGEPFKALIEAKFSIATPHGVDLCDEMTHH